MVLEALKEQGTLPISCRLSTLLTGLSVVTDSFDRVDSFQRPQIIQNMLAISSLACNRKTTSNNHARACFLVGLAINQHTDTLFGQQARLFLGSYRQGGILQMRDETCIVLGLCGILRAWELDSVLDFLEDSELSPVLVSLSSYISDRGHWMNSLWKDSIVSKSRDA